MFAFGDSALFLAVFGLAAVPATGAALFFLRSWPAFWRMISIGAWAIAITGVAALAAHLTPAGTDLGATLGRWADLSPVRLVLAPPLALAFQLASVCAPVRSARLALLCAGVVETVVFVWGLLLWLPPLR